MNHLEEIEIDLDRMIDGLRHNPNRELFISLVKVRNKLRLYNISQRQKETTNA